MENLDASEVMFFNRIEKENNLAKAKEVLKIAKSLNRPVRYIWTDPVSGKTKSRLLNLKK